MLKKLTSLLLSLLLCLSLLPGQARAADVPDPADPPAVVEPLAPEEPEEPETPMPSETEGNVPGDEDNHHN